MWHVVMGQVAIEIQSYDIVRCPCSDTCWDAQPFGEHGPQTDVTLWPVRLFIKYFKVRQLILWFLLVRNSIELSKVLNFQQNIILLLLLNYCSVIAWLPLVCSLICFHRVIFHHTS